MSRSFAWLFMLVVVVWCVGVINHYLGYRLNQFALVPRSVPGAIGILTAPFLHPGLRVMVWNTLPFLALGLLVALQGGVQLARVTGFAWIVSGLLLWLVADHGRYLGASGVVFGYLGFLVISGWRERRIVSFLLGLLLAVGYALLLARHLGYAHFRLPVVIPMPWAMHLAGMASGVLAGFFFSRGGSRWRMG